MIYCRFQNVCISYLYTNEKTTRTKVKFCFVPTYCLKRLLLQIKYWKHATIVFDFCCAIPPNLHTINIDHNLLKSTMTIIEIKRYAQWSSDSNHIHLMTIFAPLFFIKKLTKFWYYYFVRRRQYNICPRWKDQSVEAKSHECSHQQFTWYVLCHIIV